MTTDLIHRAMFDTDPATAEEKARVLQWLQDGGGYTTDECEQIWHFRKQVVTPELVQTHKALDKAPLLSDEEKDEWIGELGWVGEWLGSGDSALAIVDAPEQFFEPANWCMD